MVTIAGDISRRTLATAILAYPAAAAALPNAASARPARQTLSSLEAAVAIRALAERYALAIDRRDADELRGCFTKDATMRGEGLFLRGDFADEVIKGHIRFFQTMHIINNCHCIVDGSRATSAVYGVANWVFDEPMPRRLFELYMRYDDVLKRVDGQWLFAERVLTTLFVKEGIAHPYSEMSSGRIFKKPVKTERP